MFNPIKPWWGGGRMGGEKKIQKNIKFSGGNMFLHRGYCQKIRVRVCKNSFSCRIKYLYVQEVVSTSSFKFVKQLHSIFC